MLVRSDLRVAFEVYSSGSGASPSIFGSEGPFLDQGLGGGRRLYLLRYRVCHPAKRCLKAMYADPVMLCSAGEKSGGWGDWLCSRYDKSFPATMNGDPRLGDPAARTFTCLPCSGALIRDTVTQLNAIKSQSQDLITITAGGNDAYITDILNECIFQWAF